MTDTMPQVGQPAPGFSGATENGTIIASPNYLGKWVVLYFYPKDNTPGCTKEACSLRDNIQAISDVNAVVIGVSLDDPESHKKFIEKFGLPFTLIADTNHAISSRYGVYGEKVRCGKVSLGITRTTFLIDPTGIIRKVFSKVDVDSHGEEVLKAIRDAR
jgi:peroxiredoxin Q/BCP